MSKAFGTPFGVTKNGEEVRELVLDNGVLSCRILTFGGTVRALTVPGREGPVDVVLGYDSLAQYETEGGYLGALVGRFANRIAQGRFVLDGREHVLACNDGPNHLHGGVVGWSHRVTYALEGEALTIHYEAVSDRDTPVNLTNHSYFNLAGHDSGTVLDQELQLFCTSYTPTDETSIPLGRIDPVEGTPMDLRASAPIGARIGEDFQQLVWGRGYDHNFVVDGQPGVMRPAAVAHSSATGIVMEVETDSPGVQFYSANFIEDGRKGKGGAVYGFRHAFCLETQYFPDSPNQPAFPSCILRAGEEYDQTTRFRFSVQGE